MKQQAYQLIEFEGAYYFVDYYDNDHRYLINRRVYLSEQFVEGSPFTKGYYEFGADGKMIIKHGPQADGTFYLNGVKQQAYQLIQFEGDYYFVDYYDGDHRYLRNKNVHLAEEFLVGTDFTPWYYEFDAEGKMIGHTSNIINGRDIGQIPFMTTSDGKDIKEGLLFRGPSLDGIENEITAEKAAPGIDYLKNTFKAKMDMDLRDKNYEFMDVPDALGDDILHKYYGMVFYTEAFTEEGKQIVKEIFVDLANPDNYPIYIHCAHGVDRVGTVCYILEALLGVPESNMAREFMLSITAYGNDILKVRDCINKYEGETLKDRTEAYLLDCGVTQEQIDTIRDIFIGE